MKIKKGLEYELDIIEMAYGGKGIAKLPTAEGEWVVFVPNTIPGQKVSARLIKKRRKHGEAKLLQVIQRSPKELDLPYQDVSGAPFAQLPIEEQRFYKKRDSLVQFDKLAGIKDMEARFDEFIHSPEDWFYRNKMDYSFSAIGWDRETDLSVDEFTLGFKRRGLWWAAENLLKPSGLFDIDFETKLKDIKEYCQASGLPAWHAPGNHGFFRNLMVRKSFDQDLFLISLQTTSDGLESFSLDEFADFLEQLFPERIAGVLHTLSDEKGDRFNYRPEDTRIIRGTDHLEEDLLGLRFEISLSSFFQTNPASAERLYTKLISYAKEYGREGVILDLFCGTGTIGQLIAREWPDAEVIGVDIVESAILDARRNAARNRVDNIEFHAADVGAFLKEHPDYVGRISTIILDPPRSGIIPKALEKTIALGAKTILYVSCNPATQARDTGALMAAGYRLVTYSLVDQFPHTNHIEGIGVFDFVGLPSSEEEE